MKNVIAFMVFAFSSLLLVLGGAYSFFKLLSNFGINPTQKMWDNMAEKLRKLLEKPVSQLVPWDSDMLSLLSLNELKAKKEGFWGRDIEQGSLTTIYHEPVVAYAKASAGKQGNLLVASTSHWEFIFRQKKGETEIWVNKEPLGVLVNGVLLGAGKNSKQLAQLDTDTQKSQLIFTISDIQVGTITNPDLAKPPLPRALALLQNLTENEEKIALALTLITILQKK